MLDRDIAPITLPAINFHNIGKGGNVTAGDAIEQVVVKYLSAVQNAAQQQGLLKGVPGFGDAKGLLNDAAEGLNSFFR
jgi:hypothetical protein